MIRVLSFLLAVGMIVAAFVVRAEEPEDAGTDRPIGAASGAPSIRCDAELEVACRALRDAGHDVTSEPAGRSYEALQTAAATEAPDAWLTIAPWPAMVDEARTRAGLAPLFRGSEPPLAVSPLVLVIWDERGAALEPNCPTGALDVGCVTAAAGESWEALGGQGSWGSFKVGLQDPTTSSIGLAVLAVATADQLGTSGFGTRSLTEGAYLDWLTALAGAVPDFSPPAGSALATMLQIGPASFDVAATTEAAAVVAREGGAQRADQLRVFPADQTATVDVVLAVHADLPDPDAIVRAATEALAAAGWGVAAPSGAADPPFDGPAGASLPGSGAQTALRNAFADTVRR
jgi:hypothetical protein